MQKRRGRPPGSKNKNKEIKPAPTIPAPVVAVAEVAAPKRRGRPPGIKKVEKVEVKVEKIEKVIKQEVKTSGFNILERGPKMREAVQEALARGEKEAKLIVGDPNRPKLLIPVIPFQMQVALKSRGLVSGTILEIIGQEAVGKTTLKNTIFGWAIRCNCPVADFESEAKPMFKDRVKECLYWDKAIAEKMYNSIYRKEVHDIVTLVDEAESWLMQIRDPRSVSTYVPITIPSVIGIDSWSKLLDPGEAGSFEAYGGPPTLALKASTKPGKEKSEKTKAREREKAKKDAAKARAQTETCR